MCYASEGDLPMTFQWFKDEEAIHLLDGIALYQAGPRTSILNIEQLNAHHSGTYKCVAKNPAGKSIASADLNIQGI